MPMGEDAGNSTYSFEVTLPGVHSKMSWAAFLLQLLGTLHMSNEEPKVFSRTIGLTGQTSHGRPSDRGQLRGRIGGK